MLELTRGNIQTITETVDKAEISFSHLRDELIDHICCEVENLMQNGLDFQKAFAKIKKNTGILDLQKVQEKTLLLIDKKYCIMKKTMKVSGITSVILLMFASIFKINHWPGASIMLVLGFFTLCTMFIPSALYVMRQEQKDHSSVFLFISALLSSIIFFLGILFKIMHWPGANIMLLIGDGIIILMFLPALLFYLVKKSINNAEKIIYSIAIFSGMVYLYGFLSKLFHWPGAGILLTFSALILVVVFIPAFTIYKYKNEKYIKGSFIYIIVGLSWFILFSILMSLSISKNIMNKFVEENISLQNSIMILEDQNHTLISEYKNAGSAQVNNIRKLSDDLCNYIENIKTDIVIISDKDNPDAIKNNKVIVNNLSNFSNTSISETITLGEEENGSAYHLKEKIDYIRQAFVGIVNKDNSRTQIVNSLLKTSVPEEVSWTNSWEVFYFRRAPVISCLNVLTALQRNIRLAENEVLLSIHNQ